jgi:hypothetical protein
VIWSPDLRHSAIGADFGATFRYLEISSTRSGRKGTGCLFVIKKIRPGKIAFSSSFPAQNGRKVLEVASPYKEVHFRHLFFKRLSVSLGKTSGYSKHPATSFLLKATHFENGVERFPGCILDERAGVDDEDFGL